MRIASRYPPRLPETSDIEKLARELVDEEFPTQVPVIKKSTRIFCTGSCFSQNIGISLGNAGYDSFHLSMVESENSTFATRRLLESNNEETIKILTEGLPVTLAQVTQKIRNTDCLILTLGVALIILNENGKYEPGASKRFYKKKSKSMMYMTSIEENVENVVSIISTFKKFNPDLKIFLTVSPIPLVAGLPSYSGFTSDCISKSIMRTTAHVVMNKGLDNLYYWPSFEIVRWLAAHTGPTFGAEDIGSRHVNQDLIDLIILLFLEKFSD